MTDQPTPDGTLETRGDSATIRFERRIGHPVERVWAALTEPSDMHATIARLEPQRLLELDGDIHGVLRFELEADGATTILRFSSTLELPDEFRTKVLAGWHTHLDALATVLDGGRVDLVDIADGHWERVHAAYVEREP